MICFQISIFEPLKTANCQKTNWKKQLWFAFKLVSLNRWKQRVQADSLRSWVVICFQISIFEPLKTAALVYDSRGKWLWFAFKLVSLNRWKQPEIRDSKLPLVVICFQISIFEPLKTAKFVIFAGEHRLWFAFKLVSLNRWKQLRSQNDRLTLRCDLLSN